MGGKITEETFEVCMPSEVLLLRNIANFETTKNDDVFSDLYSDIVDKCQEYGQVEEVKIPRPIFVDR